MLGILETIMAYLSGVIYPNTRNQLTRTWYRKLYLKYLVMSAVTEYTGNIN